MSEDAEKAKKAEAEAKAKAEAEAKAEDEAKPTAQEVLERAKRDVPPPEQQGGEDRPNAKTTSTKTS